MSKAQELNKMRERRGYTAPIRTLEVIDGATTMESYYEGILSDEEIEVALRSVRRHIVGGANRTLISAETPLRSCRIGTCRRLSAG